MPRHLALFPNHNLPHLALNPITPNNRVRYRRTPIFKCHLELPVLPLLNTLQTLPKPCNIVTLNKLHHLIQIRRSMNPIRTHRTPARKQFFLVSPRLIIHPVEEIKPNIFLVFPLVLGHDFVESLENALVTN
jgi:hypothetical protein